MAIQYWIKKNYEMDYAQDNWLLLSLEEFEEFLKTPDGQKRKNGIARMPYCEKDEVSYWECGEDEAEQWRMQNRRHNYLVETAEEVKAEIISIEGMLNEDGEEFGEDCIPDPDEDVVRDVIKQMEKQRLHTVLSILKEAEMEMIFQLYLREKPITEKEYAVLIGESQQTVHYRKKALLEKIRKNF